MIHHYHADHHDHHHHQGDGRTQLRVIVWRGFSLHWYSELFHNRLIMESLYSTLLVSLLATVISTAAGTFAAIGLYSLSRRKRDALLVVRPGSKIGDHEVVHAHGEGDQRAGDDPRLDLRKDPPPGGGG